MEGTPVVGYGMLKDCIPFCQYERFSNGRSIMEDIIYKPEDTLSSFIKLIWIYDGYKPSSRIERVLPNGSSQIIINLAERSFRHFQNPKFTLSETYDDVILAGVQTRPVFLDAYTRISTMGVILNPGAIQALFQVPAEEFRDKIVSLQDLSGRDVSGLRQKLITALTSKERIRILETFLKAHLNPSSNLMPAIRFAIDRIHCSHGTVPISRILDHTGYSQRWLSQKFRDHTGVTPKQYAKICRFQHVVKTLRKTERLNWTDLALDCGYFDQPHLIHDFQGLAGIAPSEYYHQQGVETNHLAVQTR